jgi:hypothetical protein
VSPDIGYDGALKENTSFASKIYLLTDYIEKEVTLVALFFSSFFAFSLGTGCFLCQEKEEEREKRES